MKVKVKKSYREAEMEFYKIPQKDRENIIFWSCMDLIPDKFYDVIKIETHGWYRIIDESGEDYMYPPEMFEVIEEKE